MEALVRGVSSCTACMWCVRHHPNGSTSEGGTGSNWGSKSSSLLKDAIPKSHFLPEKVVVKHGVKHTVINIVVGR